MATPLPLVMAKFGWRLMKSTDLRGLWKAACGKSSIPTTETSAGTR